MVRRGDAVFRSMVPRTCSLPTSTKVSTQSRWGDSRNGSRKPKVRVRDSRRRVSSAACSHSSRTAVRAAAEAPKDGLRKSSCRSSPCNRRTVASSTRASSRPRRDSAQSVRATGSGRAPARAQRRTASAAAAGSSLQFSSGAGSWPVVAVPSPVFVPSAGRGPGAPPSARCTAPLSSAGSRSSAPCAAAATNRDSTASSRAAYSSGVLPRSTCPPPVASCPVAARAPHC